MNVLIYMKYCNLRKLFLWQLLRKLVRCDGLTWIRYMCNFVLLWKTEVSNKNIAFKRSVTLHNNNYICCWTCIHRDYQSMENLQHVGRKCVAFRKNNDSVEQQQFVCATSMISNECIQFECWVNVKVFLFFKIVPTRYSIYFHIR